MNWWNIVKVEPDTPEDLSDCPNKPMGPMTEEEMKEIWDRDNPNHPHTMRKDTGKPNWNWENMQWFLLLACDKAIGKNGFIDHGSFYLIGGATSPFYPGSLKWLTDYRELHMDADKPKVALLRAKKGEQSTWVDAHIKRKFDMNPEDVSDIPEEFVERFDDEYGRQNWGIRREETFGVKEPRTLTDEEVERARKIREGE
jgi:hypothetical protein